MDKNLFDEPGSIMLYNKISQEQMDLFIAMIARGKYEYINLLKGIFDNDFLLLEALDVLAGQRMVIPDRRKIYKTLEKVFIYTYCKARGFSEESYKSIAKQYNKRGPQVKAMVETMQKFIDSGTNEGFPEDLFDNDLDTIEECTDTNEDEDN